jgi:hypothetical protein
MIKLRYLPLISIAALSANTLFADQFSVEGVVSVGYLSVDENTFLGTDNGDDALLTENILRLTYNTDKGFSVSGQVVYRDAGDFVESDPSLDFLQLDYRGNWFGDGEQAISLGRFKIRQGLYNQSRDIAFTRPSILLPQAVYLDTSRNFVLSADGIELNGYVPYEESDLTWSIALGESVIDDKFSAAVLSPMASGDWGSDTNLYSNIQWDSQNLTLGLSHSSVELDYQPDSSAFLPFTLPDGSLFQVPLIPGGFDADFMTLSFQYREELWEFTAEITEREFRSEGFSPFASAVIANIDGYYAQFRYFLTEDITLITRFDTMEFDSDRPPQEQAPDSADKADNWMVGASWRIDDNWLFAIEQHFIEGAAWVPPLNKTSSFTNFSKEWQLTAFQLSYKF